MKQGSESSSKWIFLIGILPVAWIGLLIAPYAQDGLFGMLAGLVQAMESPLSITWTKNSPKTVLLSCLLYVVAIGVFLSSRRNYRFGEEHGSAKWGNAKVISKQYADKTYTDNRILTQNVRMSLDIYKHMKNLNTLIVGGAGSGKSRFYARPNILQGNSSYFILDPKGELLRDTGNALIKMGYKLKVLNLIDMEKSACYNPFVYLRDDNDVQRMVAAIFKATSQKNETSQDPFWDRAAQMLLMALCLYLYYEASPEEQNFATVMEMIRYGEVKEEDEEHQSPLDILFRRLEMYDSEHLAVKYYKNYHSGGGRTLKSIQITLIARLEKFNLNSLAELTKYDAMELNLLGEEKNAIFAITPDNDKSFNFLVSMLYIQMFQQLFYCADVKHKGKLPIHVHLLMDEFANVALPDDFPEILSTMRSRNISASIILQNISQLKALFKDHWESIIGNCDSFLYLGGNEQSTHKYVSELIGKATIDMRNYGKSTGRNGHYNTNYQLHGRELLTADEVRAINRRNAIVFISGERPIFDKKYDLMRHPNINLSANGKGAAYEYDAPNFARAKLGFSFAQDALQQATQLQTLEHTEYRLLSETELENLFLLEEINS